MPGASHQRRRPTDRPTVSTERSPLARPVSSREPSRGLIHLRNRRSCYALATYISDQTQRTHQPRSTNGNAEARTLVRGCTVVAAALVQVQCVAASRTHGLDEKNGAYAEPREPDRSRNKRTLDGRRRGVTSLSRVETERNVEARCTAPILVSVIRGNTRAIVPWDRGGGLFFRVACSTRRTGNAQRDKRVEAA